jgi:hypothetical protein
MFVVVAMLVVSSRAEAGLVSGFGGNTQPQVLGTEGFVNFAVFDTAGGSLGDHFGTGLANIDTELNAAGFNTTSKYLYIFQVANEGPDIASASVRVNPVTVTGDGLLAGIGFSQVTLGNRFLGSVGSSPGNISPAVTDATQSEAKAVLEVALTSPALVSLTNSSLVATFNPTLSDAGSDLSALFGYTSDNMPVYGFGSIQDGGLAANGIVPTTAIPEPSSLALGLLSIFGCMAIRFVRWRQQGEA